MGITQDLLYQIADELRAIASAGLYYTQDEYDRKRFQQVLAIALRLVANLEDRPFDQVMQEYQEDNWLHISPALGTEAVVTRGDKIMLIKRSDNGLWAVPGGLVEVGENLAEAAERELKEETGVHGQITKLLGVFDSQRWGSKTKAHIYHVIFLAEAKELKPKPSTEATEIAFFSELDLPALSPGHHLRVPFLFKLLRGEVPAPFFDTPDSTQES